MFSRHENDYQKVPQMPNSQFEFLDFKHRSQANEFDDRSEKYANDSKIKTNDEIEINEISKASQENEAEWDKDKFLFKLIELITFLIGFLITFSSILLPIWLIFFVDFQNLLDFLKINKKEQNDIFLNPNVAEIFTDSFYFYSIYVYICIELIALILYLFKFGLLMKFFRIFGRSGKHLKSMHAKRECLLAIDLKQFNDENFYAIIEKLKARVLIRNEFLDSLIKFNVIQIVSFIFFVFLVFGSKMFMAIYLRVNLDSFILDQLKNDMFLKMNSTTNGFESNRNLIKCCLKNEILFKNDPSSKENFDLFREESLFKNQNETLIESRDTTTAFPASSMVCPINKECLYSTCNFYFNMLFIFLVIISILKLMSHSMHLFNYFYWFNYRLLKRKHQEDEQLSKLYDECRQRVFANNVQQQIEENEERNFSIFFNNQLPASNNETSPSKQGTHFKTSTYKVESEQKTIPKYVNEKPMYQNDQNDDFDEESSEFEDDFDLNEDERKAVHLIDKVNNDY